MNLASRLLSSSHNFGPEVLQAIREASRVSQEGHSREAREQLGLPEGQHVAGSPLAGYSLAGSYHGSYVRRSRRNPNMYVVSGSYAVIRSEPEPEKEKEKVNWKQEGF